MSEHISDVCPVVHVLPVLCESLLCLFVCRARWWLVLAALQPAASEDLSQRLQQQRGGEHSQQLPLKY